MNIKPFVKIVSLMALLAGCVSLNTVSLTQIPAKRTNMVSARAERIIILGLNFDNDYINQIPLDLMSQCNNGVVKGIFTKDYITDYFLFFVYKHTVEAKGYCERAK